MSQSSFVSRFTAALALLLPLCSTAQPLPDSDSRCAMPPPFAGSVHAAHGMRLGPALPFHPGVELSEAQQDAAFAILHAASPALRQQEKNLHQAQEALRALVPATPDELRLQSVLERLAKASTGLELQRFRLHQKLFSLLTPEQRLRLTDCKGHADHGRSQARP